MGEGPQPPEEDQQESGEADETDTVLTHKHERSCQKQDLLNSSVIDAADIQSVVVSFGGAPVIPQH